MQELTKNPYLRKVINNMPYNEVKKFFNDFDETKYSAKELKTVLYNEIKKLPYEERWETLYEYLTKPENITVWEYLTKPDNITLWEYLNESPEKPDRKLYNPLNQTLFEYLTDYPVDYGYDPRDLRTVKPARKNEFIKNKILSFPIDKLIKIYEKTFDIQFNQVKEFKNSFYTYMKLIDAKREKMIKEGSSPNYATFKNPYKKIKTLNELINELHKLGYNTSKESLFSPKRIQDRLIETLTNPNNEQKLFHIITEDKYIGYKQKEPYLVDKFIKEARKYNIKGDNKLDLTWADEWIKNWIKARNDPHGERDPKTEKEDFERDFKAESLKRNRLNPLVNVQDKIMLTPKYFMNRENFEKYFKGIPVLNKNNMLIGIKEKDKKMVTPIRQYVMFMITSKKYPETFREQLKNIFYPSLSYVIKSKSDINPPKVAPAKATESKTEDPSNLKTHKASSSPLPTSLQNIISLTSLDGGLDNLIRNNSAQLNNKFSTGLQGENLTVNEFRQKYKLEPMIQKIAGQSSIIGVIDGLKYDDKLNLIKIDLQNRSSHPLFQPPAKKPQTSQTPETKSQPKTESKTENKKQSKTKKEDKKVTIAPKKNKGSNDNPLSLQDFIDKQNKPSGKGIRSDYREFGINKINHKKLDDGILTIRRQSNINIPDMPSKKISQKLQKIIKHISGGGIPEHNDIQSLEDGEKDYLHKLISKSNLQDRLSVPAPSKDQEEKDFHQFEVMKGEIMSGNDSKELVKNFKVLLLKLSKQNVLPKTEVNELMTDLLSLGY
jgi:hypothetical protein